MCPGKAPRDVTQPAVEMTVRNSLRRVAAGEALKNRRGVKHIEIKWGGGGG